MQIPYRKPGKDSLIEPDYMMTANKIEELKNKLIKLKKIQPQAASEVTRLAQLGDFSENAEYQLAKGKLRSINNKILSLEQQLIRANVIKKQDQKDIIEIGHTVTIDNGDKEKKYQILGSQETSPAKGIISRHSPLGLALLGHKIGEKITVNIAGKKIEYTIKEIS